MKDKRYIHFAYCPFTGLGKREGFRGNKWLKNRLEVFKRFVVPSLQNQSTQDFVLWVSWRPEERNNKLVKEFKKWLEEKTNIKHVFTYHGLCFWDDVYPDTIAHERLLMSLHLSIPELNAVIKDFTPEGEVEWVYMTIQPSDDMFDKEAFKTIQSCEHSLTGWRKGYIINYSTKEVAEYNPTTTPPFYTFLFPAKVFFNAQDHAEFTGPYKSHEYIGDKQKYHELPGRGFCVGTHGENISTVFNHIFKGRRVEGDIWDRFGIKDSEPVHFRKGYRLWFRVLVNRCSPKVQKVLKRIYYNVLFLD